ncbi:glucose-1-phosphate thymidyltransferase, partial [mine drainage metagenome]
MIELDGERIVSLAEKPADPRSSLALVGVYVFDARLFPILDRLTPSARGELEITEALDRLVREGARVGVEHIRGFWKDTGRPEDYLRANHEVLASRPPLYFDRPATPLPPGTLHGPVRVGAGTTIDPTARIVGPTVLGAEVAIGPDSVVGPFCSIGHGARIWGATIRESVVMDRARIEGPVELADSILGRDASVTAGPR